MDADRTDARYRTPKDLAGPHYEAMMRNKEAAISYLSAPDYETRIAAILLCESTWGCGVDPRVLDACRQIAGSDGDDSVRCCAVSSLGRALNSTRSPDASQFLARIAKDPKNAMDLRITAYWALREVQLGLADSNSYSHVLYLAKSYIRQHPGRFTEDEVMSNLLGSLPKSNWDLAGQIDLEFVNQFVGAP
jgi:hypothetical protein